MADEKPLTGVKKRQQISDTRKQVFLWVALASAVVVVCIMVGINLIQRISYQTKVNGELGKTAKTMKQNASNIDELIANVNKLKANQVLTLPNLKSDDSTVFQVVIDALPTEDDSTALSSSLQNKVLSRSGVTIDQISVESTSTDGGSTDDASATTSSSSVDFPKAQPITFRISFVGSYDAVESTLRDIERTIRPITISQMTIDGSDEKLTVTIDATTYYSSSVNFQMGKKTVPYENDTRGTATKTTKTEAE